MVTNSPISITFPVTPPALIVSPALKGRSTIRNAPAAKLERSPPQAAPIARPAPATKAAKEVVSIPKTPNKTTARTTFSATFTVLRA